MMSFFLSTILVFGSFVSVGLTLNPPNVSVISKLNTNKQFHMRRQAKETPTANMLERFSHFATIKEMLQFVKAAIFVIIVSFLGLASLSEDSEIR